MYPPRPFTLSAAEKTGFNKFVETGCQTCHNGPYLGGSSFQKLGIFTPWPNTKDEGREAVTHQAADRMVFKVPSLRNVNQTAPYFHDGSIATIEDAIRSMGVHQGGARLTDAARRAARRRRPARRGHRRRTGHGASGLAGGERA